MDEPSSLLNAFFAKEQKDWTKFSLIQSGNKMLRPLRQATGLDSLVNLLQESQKETQTSVDLLLDEEEK